LGVGNSTGGINGTPRPGTGGILDSRSWGLRTGGILGAGCSLDAGTGGIRDNVRYGQDVGGISGSIIGAGSGGIADLNSLGAGTGGMNGPNAIRFRFVQ
jgi:hypothetical protein